MQTRNLWMHTLGRIGVAVIILGTVMAGLTYWLGMQRVDATAFRLAQGQADYFINKHLAGGTTALNTPELEAAVRDGLQENFPVVILYDQDQNKQLDVVADGKDWIESAAEDKPAVFPTGKQATYDRFDLNGNTFIQIMIPLRSGYFNGVYEVDPQTLHEIKHGVQWTTLIVFLSVVVTGMLLLPLLMRLNREIILTSKGILAGNIELMEVLGSAIAKRDSDTNTHNYRVTLYAIELAYAVNLPQKAMQPLIAGSFLHDVGKIGIPDDILKKAGKLNKTEFAIMKTHVDLGGDILNKSSWLSDAKDVVLNHHEKYSGGGYPKGLKGAEIPITARIFAIVDVFDALTSKRPYKEPMPLDKALEILRRDSGRHFDPELVATFIKIAPNLYQRMKETPDETIENLLRKEATYFYGIQ